jgi:RNA polymerase sigma-70 factor (ECF subfamily)
VPAQIRNDENLLIEQARQGDRTAFGELVRQHQASVIAVVTRMCGDIHLAEDAAQDAFIKAWRHLDGYQPNTNLCNWLYRIAINSALDILRRERGHPGGDAIPDQRDPKPGPEHELMKKQRSLTIQKAIMALTESNRSVLVLREYGGMSYLEIAAALEIPLGTVMSRLNTARAQLRLSLQPLLEEMEVVDE